MPPAPGMRFGRYELLAPLGAGGMGEVYRARDRDLGRDVAVKFLAPRFASDPDRLARFTFEARAASSLNHPNIVTIHEIGEAEGLPYIVMELVEGETLRRAMADARLPTRRVLDVAAQIAEGLAKAHAAGIVHRDLKPENVMLTPDGFVKILDFGLAKLRPDAVPGMAPSADAQSESPTTFRAGTRLGAIVGTVGYMSPEQAAGRAVDYRADQFALGATMYEMASGRQAFHRDSVVQTLNAIIEHDPPPLAELNPSFPAPARWIAERCLSKAPGDRYASTLDLARELRGVREHLSEVSGDAAEPRPVPAPVSTPVPAPVPTPVPVPVPPPRRLRAWHVVAAAAVVLASLMAIPAIRIPVLERLHLLPLPAEKCIAVLPVECLVTTAEEKAACAGLLDSVVSRLSALQRYREGLTVVPAQEVWQANAKESVDALRRLSATLAVRITVRRTSPDTEVVATLVDARNGRELRAQEKSFPARQASLVDETVDAVVGMLDMELSPRERTALTAGSARVPMASWLYLEAVGRTPYQLAQTALERADQQPSVDAAIKLFNKALELEPGYALAHVGLGRAYLSLYQIENRPEYARLAEDHCDRANELERLMPHAWLTLGAIHTQLRDYPQALEDLTRALDRDPGSDLAYARMGYVYQLQRRDPEAEQAYRKAISLAQKSWWPYAYYGAFLDRRGRYPEAERQFRIAHEIAPDNPRILSNLGGVLWKQQRQAEARVAIEKSIQLYPTSGALSNYATLEFGDKRYAEAAAIYKRAAQLGQRDYRIWRNMGLAYSLLEGEQAGVEAQNAFRTALGLAEQERQRDPNNGMLVAQMADCHAKLGNEADARSLLADAEKLEATNYNVPEMAAGIYEDMGDRDAALRLLAVAFARGLPRERVEKAATFDKLRADPRYQALVARLALARKK